MHFIDTQTVKALESCDGEPEHTELYNASTSSTRRRSTQTINALESRDGGPKHTELYHTCTEISYERICDQMTPRAQRLDSASTCRLSRHGNRCMSGWSTPHCPKPPKSNDHPSGRMVCTYSQTSREMVSTNNPSLYFPHQIRKTACALIWMRCASF